MNSNFLSKKIETSVINKTTLKHVSDLVDADYDVADSSCFFFSNLIRYHVIPPLN